MRSKHDAGHIQSFYANASAALMPRHKTDWMQSEVGLQCSAVLRRTVQRSEVRFVFAIKNQTRVGLLFESVSKETGKLPFSKLG